MALKDNPFAKAPLGKEPVVNTKPRRYKIFEDPEMDQRLDNQNALKSVLSNVEPTPHPKHSTPLNNASEDVLRENLGSELTEAASSSTKITAQIPSNHRLNDALTPPQQGLNTVTTPSQQGSNGDQAVLQQRSNTVQTELTHRSDTVATPLQQGSDTVVTASQQRSDTVATPLKRRLNGDLMPSKHRSNAVETPRELPRLEAYLNQIPKGLRLIDYIASTQAEVLGLIFNSCVQNKSNTTGPISYKHLMQITGASHDGITNRLRTLKARGIIQQGAAKIGRGGWVTFELPEPIYKRLSEEGTEITAEIPPNHRAFHREISPRKNRIEIKSNLSDLGPEAEEPEFSFEYGDWEFLNLDPVQGYQFRVDKLRSDVTNQKLTVDVATLQDMIERFPIYVMGLPTAPSKPYGLFMSLVQKRSKGNDVLVGTPTCYEVWAAEATKRRIAEQNTAFNQAFMEWEATMPDSERIEMVKSESENPFMDFNDTKDPRFRELLLASFRNKIWSKKP